MQPIDGPIAQYIENFTQDYLNQGMPFGVFVGVVSDGQPTGTPYGNLIGYDSGQPITFDSTTPFEIGSCTKTFTATLYEQAVANNPSVADATLGTYLTPSTPLLSQFANLPLQYLVNYTSGLPADNTQNTDRPPRQPYPYTPDTMYSWIGTSGNVNVATPPPQSFAYSNLGFALLADAMPAALGSSDSYPALLQDVIFDNSSLNMTSTHLYSPSDNTTLPMGYRSNNQQAIPYNTTWPAYNGAGGLVTNADDFMTWLMFNMNLLPGCSLNPLLPALQQQTASTGSVGIGAAWFLPDLESGLQAVTKDGGVPGFHSWIGFVNASQTGTFVLANFDFPVTTLGANILRLLNGYSARS